MEHRSAYWVFTLNNYTDSDIERLESLPYPEYFVVFGQEVAPSTGTPHLQGFIRFSKRVRRTGVEKMLGGRAWCAVTHAPTAAIGYACKEGLIHSNKEIPENVGEKCRLTYKVCCEMGMKKYIYFCVYNSFDQDFRWSDEEDLRVCCGYLAYCEDIHWWDKNTWKKTTEEAPMPLEDSREEEEEERE